MDEEITKREVKTGQGTFTFELVEYPGPSPMIDVHLGTTHIGYADYCNLKEASDLELLELASYNIRYESEEDEWS